MKTRQSASSVDIRPPEHPVGEATVNLLVGLGGTVLLETAQGPIELGTGDVVIVDSTSLTGFSSSDVAEYLVMADSSLAFNLPLGIVAQGSGSARLFVILLRAIFATLESGPSPDDPAAQQVLSALLDLAAAASRSTTMLQRNAIHGRGDQLYRDATDLILTRFHDPGLTAQAIARTLGCSRATLNRAFARYDESAGHTLAKVRARRARSLLAAGRCEIEVAQMVGLTTVRRLRDTLARVDASPRSLRRRAWRTA